MKITEKDVRYVADLAHLRLSGEEVRRMCVEMDEILVYMDKLNELDTATVEPMAQVLYDAEATVTLREDSERPTLASQTALGSAPVTGEGYFKVPKVIER